MSKTRFLSFRSIVEGEYDCGSEHWPEELRKLFSAEYLRKRSCSARLTPPSVPSLHLPTQSFIVLLASGPHFRLGSKALLPYGRNGLERDTPRTR